MTSNAKVLVAGVALAASLIAVGPASAALIVNPITGGTGPAGAFESNDIGTVMGLHVSSANTYEFSFTVAPSAVLVLSQLQASIPHHNELVEFSLYSGAPSASPPPADLIDISMLTTGPELTDIVGAGDYFLKLDVISQTGELVSGSLDLSGVPEPATWAMMLFGVTGLGAVLRRKRMVAVEA